MFLARCIQTALLLLLPLMLTGSAAAQGQLPPAGGNVPKVGEKVPDFTLPDTTGKPVKLSELLAQPADGAKAALQKGSWVLLIFYRGYW